MSIERVLLDGAGNPLLNLWRLTADQALFVSADGEKPPEIQPVGTVEEVAGTGIRLYAGPDAVKGGAYTLAIGTHGRTHADMAALQHEVLRAAVKTRAIQRTEMGTLFIARFSRITRSWRGSAQLGGAVEVAFEVASPYWWSDLKTQALTAGQTGTVNVSGNAPTGVRITFTPSQSVTNPTFTTAGGVTRLLGTYGAGSVIVVDGQPGVWTVTVNGVDQALKLDGPQPLLLPGSNAVTVSGAGAVQLAWREGYLGGIAGAIVPENGTGAGALEWRTMEWA